MAPSCKHTHSRRCFLKDAALGALGAGALLGASCAKRPPEQKAAEAPAPPPAETAAPPVPKAMLPPSGERSRVVIARHSGVTANGEVQEAALGDTVDRAVMALTGESSPEKAWQKCFSSDEKIGIKVNGLGGPNISTSPLLTKVCDH